MDDLSAAWRCKVFEDGGIALHVDRVLFVNLNRSAAWVVDRLVRGVPIDGTVEEYAESFGVSAEQAAQEVASVCAQLQEAEDASRAQQHPEVVR